MLFDVRRHSGLSPPVFRKLAHQFQELPGGLPRFRLRLDRPKLSHDLIMYGDLYACSHVFSDLADQFGQPPPGLADRDFHGHPRQDSFETLRSCALLVNRKVTPDVTGSLKVERRVEEHSMPCVALGFLQMVFKAPSGDE